MAPSKLKNTLTLLFLVYAIFGGIDIYSDFRDGASWQHLSIEATLLAAALAGFWLLTIDYLRSKRKNAQLNKSLLQLQAEAQIFRNSNRAFTQGLSQSIDAQLSRWNLTHAEKEIALFLMKGFSLKEIGDLRQSSERTVRSQSNSIYQKSGLSGRAELSAFFLEDLLDPSTAKHASIQQKH